MSNNKTLTIVLCVSIAAVCFLSAAGSVSTKLQKERIPTDFIVHLLSVFALSTNNFAVAICYGRPFGSGHTIDGLFLLSAGTLINSGILVYQALRGHQGKRPNRTAVLLWPVFALLTETYAIALAAWDLGVSGWKEEGSNWWAAFAVISWSYSVVCIWAAGLDWRLGRLEAQVAPDKKDV